MRGWGEARNLERVRYVTENYERLQGLRYLPFALALAVWGVVDAYFFEQPDGFFDFVPLRDLAYLLVGIAPLLFWAPTSRYYERRFGTVLRRRRKRKLRNVGPLLFLGVVVVVVVVLGLPGVREVVGQPLRGLAAGILLAGFILYALWPERHRLTSYWAVLAALSIVVGALPALGLLDGGDLPRFVLLLGFVLAAGCLLDHLLLISTLKALPEEGDSADG